MIQPGIAVPEKLRPVVLALIEATIYAADTQSSEWDFAVSIDSLKSLGANETDLRWLARKNFVSHAREVTLEGDDGREFRPTGNLTFCEQTCFVLTNTGLVQLQGKGFHCTEHETQRDGNGQLEPAVAEQPIWDSGSRKLQYGGLIVKRFKWPAANQERVLCAFQEEGWPERIDDPLVPHPDQDSKRRLADTIKCLNRKHLNELICFRGDGTGEGVLWESLI